MPAIQPAEQHENTCRLDFTPSEAVEIGEVTENFQKELAANRRRATQNNTSAENFSTQDNGINGRALDKVASVTGLSRPTYTKAKKVVEFAG